MGITGINRWWWNINGTILQTQTVPSSIAPGAGPYPVKLVVTTAEGCRSDTNTTLLNVRYNPAAAFGIGDLLCNNELIRFTDQSHFPPGATGEMVAKWNWTFDNARNSTVKDPGLNFNTGAHKARLISESSAGCKSEPVEHSFEIWPKPIVKLDISDSCINLPVTYTATDQVGNVVKYNWYFIDGRKEGPNVTSITKSYNYEGKRPFTLLTYTNKGCKDTIYRPFAIYENKSFAGYDTLAAFNEPVQLDARGEPGMQYNWTPAIGLNRSDIEKPVATYDRDQLYHLYTATAQGCEKQTRIFIKRWAGPELFVPNAFTPDNDGVNDKLKVKPTGYKSFGFFAVYNRWGQLMFRTTNFNEGWDGKINGLNAEAGTYVYVVQAVDYKGKPLHRKGTVILLR
jgi:gliding motility-associated-like protein